MLINDEMTPVELRQIMNNMNRGAVIEVNKKYNMLCSQMCTYLSRNNKLYIRETVSKKSLSVIIRRIK